MFSNSSMQMIRNFMTLCRPPLTVTALQHSCHICPALHAWFCENGMALNSTKSDAILLCTSQRLKSGSGFTSVNVADSNIHLPGSVKVIGSTLTMRPHAKVLSKSCFHHIRSFKQIPSSMDHSTAVSVALALVPSMSIPFYPAVRSST